MSGTISSPFSKFNFPISSSPAHSFRLSGSPTFNLLTCKPSNDLRPHSNANHKVIDKQYTIMLFSPVYTASIPRVKLYRSSPSQLFNLQTFEPANHSNLISFPLASLAAPHPLTSIESDPYKNHRGAGGPFMIPLRSYVHTFRHLGNGRTLGSLFSLLAQRVFHNSFVFRWFRAR